MAENHKPSGTLSARCGAWMLRRGGWQVVGDFPSRSSVIVVAPHTSNWDFFWLLMLAFQWRVIGKVLWIGKHTIFRGPWGPYFRSIGGIAVDRNKPNHIVGTIARHLKERSPSYFALAPEGTRSKTDAWKKGFYFIARRAEVPVVLAFIDYKNRRIGIGPSIELSGDIETDWHAIRSFYRAEWARYPQHFSDMRFRS